MSRSQVVLLVATMDTKGQEAAFLQEQLTAAGMDVLIMDAGIRGESPRPVEVTRHQVAEAAGVSLEQVRATGHEGKALDLMIKGAKALALELYQQDRIGGVLGLGGSMGTTLGTAVMRCFAVGVPKVMISTMASRDTRAFVDTKDIMMLHAVCDLAGLNRITRRVLRNGALAMAGMLGRDAPAVAYDRPLAAVSTLGTTETSAQAVRRSLEDRGYEVVVFHTVGSGGKAMDELVAAGEVDVVVELSLHELADHAFGGDYDAGPGRARAALDSGIPTVLAPGNIDFLVTGPMAQARRRFPDRQYHAHNAAITVVKSTAEELRAMGGQIADLLGAAQGPACLLVPLIGLSAFNSPGAPFFDEGGVEPFVAALRAALPQGSRARFLDCHINDPQFSQAVVEELLGLAKEA